MIALVFGTMLATWASFLFSLASKKLLVWPALVVFIAVIAFSRPKLRKLSWVFWVVFLGWGIFLAKLFSQMMVETPEGIWAGGSNVWGDWAGHMGYIANWLYGENFPPQNPWYTGQRLAYPFLFDFLSSILVKTGLPLVASMSAPGFVLSLSLVVLFFTLTKKLTRSDFAAAVATAIFMFSGGLGWLYLLPDQNLLAVPPGGFRELTHSYEANIQWVNFVISEMVPQRGILVGLNVALAVFLLWLKAKEEKSKKHFFLSGLLAGLVPFFHAHTFLLLGFLGLIFFLIKPSKIWFYFFIPAAFLASWQFLYFLPQVESYGPGFIRWQPGWTAHVQADNWLWFWGKNIGIAAILIPVAWAKSWGKNRKLFFFYIPFVFIFLLCNLFVFQPWENDNTKLLRFWYLGSSILTADFLVRGAKKGLFQKIFVVFLLINLTFSGAYDAFSWLNFEKNKLLLWSRQEIELAETVKNITAKDSVFLTTDAHNHWVVDLSGRKIVMGFRGWLWSWGINYAEREKDVVKMFAGHSDTTSLLKKYNVTYVIVGPGEKQTFGANEDYYLQNFPLTLDKYGQKIFNVKMR